MLAVPDEPGLLAVEAKLKTAGIAHCTFHEPDAPYFGAATALGIQAGTRDKLRKLLSGLPLLK